jgi:glycerate 2-kinase
LNALNPNRLLDRAREIWLAGVDAVRGDRLIEQTVSLDEQFLHLGDLSIERTEFDRVLIVGAGKAVASMTLALDRTISPHVPTRGWVNVPDGTFDANRSLLGDIRIHAARPHGINEPTEAVLEGTGKILQLVRSAGRRDLVIVVLSGGGSALLAYPSEGVSLTDKLSVIRLLSGAGADIQQLNTIRKQLSLVKGGGLARASRGGRLVTLVLSDVLGDPIDVIASGPTVNNPTTADDAIKLLKQYDPEHQLSSCIYDAMDQNRKVVRFPIATDTVILGNNARAVDAAGIRAESLGYSHAMTAATASEGAAELIGSHLADMAMTMLRDRDAGKQTPDCLITGGEPTVQLAPPNMRGKGGRNMHLVLAAMNRLGELGLDRSTLNRIVILSGGTDGEDGPTDAAGAILSSEVWQAARDRMLEPKDYLSRSDSYNFFKQAGGLFITGPTHTNVCDIRVVLIDSH